jgi:hypothetical protein
VLTLRLLFVMLPITRLAVLLFPRVGLTTTIGVTNRAGIAVVIALRRSVRWATSDVLQLNSLAVRQHEGDPSVCILHNDAILAARIPELPVSRIRPRINSGVHRVACRFAVEFAHSHPAGSGIPTPS